MLSKQNLFILAALLMGSLLIFCVFVGFHSSFHTCINEAAATYQAEHYENRDQPIPSVPFLHGYASCANRVARHDEGVITAIATALLTAITLGLVFLGVEQSRTTRAQLRAYVFIDSASLTDGPTWPQAPVPAQNGCPNSAIWIKNHGTTPAFKVRHWQNVTVSPVNVDGTVPPPAIAIDDKTVRDMSQTAIGPGAQTHLGRNLGRALTPFEIQALGAPNTSFAILVYGRILYEDAFGDEHVTDYCVGYAGVYPIPPGTILTFMSSGNRAT
jgi:hypothetical protein